MAVRASRIVALDALRGAGILGILAVHIQLFAMPLAARTNPTAYGDLGGVDGAIWLLTYALADGKFIAIFAMLFGAGIAMQATRREAAGLPAAPQHYRRMAALLVIGGLHAYLLWYGDMLVTFALCGALVFLHRELSPARLIVAGLVFLGIAPLLSSTLAWAAPDVIEMTQALSGSSPTAMAGELAAYRGGFFLQQTHRVPTAWGFQTSYLVVRGVWQTSGLMLLGMGLFRIGVLTGARPARWYGALAAGGFGAGVPLMLLAARRGFAHGWDLRDHMLVGIHLQYWGNVLVGLGWMGAILLLLRRGLVPRAVVAVGRTALSNYLLETLLCTSVFYGHGLGLFGSVDRAGQLAVVAGVWTIQLVVSTWWLGRFALGPLEWALRWATLGHRVPIRLDGGRAGGVASPAHPTEEAPMPKGDSSRRIVVKFQDTVNLPYEDGAERHLSRLGIGAWSALAQRFKGIRLNRLFTVAPPERIGELVARATERDRLYRAPNLLSYFVIDAPDGVDAGALAAALREWEHVETVYIDPLDESPGPVHTNPAYAAGLQEYLKPPAVASAARGGIDAEFAWAQPHGAGDNQKFVDLERGADLTQEDIAARNIQKLHGLNSATAAADRLHGAQVLCIVAGLDNDKGVVGIAYGVQEVTYTCQVIAPGSGPGTVNRPDAVMAAIQHFTQPGEQPFGRVLLLEVQLNTTNDPTALTDVNNVMWNLMPMETAPADFDVIRLATALGIIVVEAAGNGEHNLDLFQQQISAGKFVLSRNHPGDFKDSGAIMVAGSTADYPYVPAVPAPFGGTQRTCYGSRIDCFAWAEKVATCDGGGNPPTYSRVFGGSSAASAIVAGAALLVQGIAENSPTGRLSPAAMRALLSDPHLNTHSQNFGTDMIGVMPDLKRILQQGLGVVPDVYIRDYVGDTGAVHAGAISLSPDIIVRPAPEANPAVTFGPGTEGNDMLGPTATAGQDNFVYVRVWNRSAVAAAAVIATVYYATPATLVMGNAWTQVGAPVTIPNVPAGNVMTVSNEIRWPAAQVPPAGHYCFVALVGNAQDPAPPRAWFQNFDNYYAFIRNNNNVTWRNFDVVAAPAPPAPRNLTVDGDDPYEFAFDAPGAYDSDRTFQLVVGSSLPFGSRVQLEAPLDLLSRRLPRIEREEDKGRVEIVPHGRTRLPGVTFPARSRSRCRLLVEVPRARDRDYEVYVSQLYEGFEVGRVTWRIVART